MVFAYLADFEKVPRWNYAIAETRKVSEGPVGVGTEYRQVRSIPSPSEETFRVTEFEPYARLSVAGTFGPFSGTITYVLEPSDEGTRLTNEMDLRGSGAARLLGPLAGNRVKRAVAENLERLKELLEAGA